MDLHALEPRLENWARAQRSTTRPASAQSIEGRYRKHSPDASEDPRLDVNDARLVNDAWRQLARLGGGSAGNSGSRRLGTGHGISRSGTRSVRSMPNSTQQRG
jgi:hypothetical protein